MNKICLFGASGHGKVVLEVLESQENHVIAFLDDYPLSKEMLGISVFDTSRIKEFLSRKFIISIGVNTIRKRISKQFKLEYTIGVHHKSIVSKSVEIEEGTVVMAGAVINAATKIGKHCIINTNAVVEHDCDIANFVHISPNATITGNTIIGEGTHVGAGASIIPNLNIGRWVTIGAGAVVLKDVPDYAVVVGNPAKIIKYKEKENEH